MDISDFDLFEDRTYYDPWDDVTEHNTPSVHSQHSCRSLGSWSAQCLVQHLPLLHREISSIPSALLTSLLLEAFRSNSARAVTFLFQVWPYDTLHLNPVSQLEGWWTSPSTSCRQAKQVSHLVITGVLSRPPYSKLRHLILPTSPQGLLMAPSFLKLPLLACRNHSTDDLMRHLAHLTAILDVEHVIKKITTQKCDANARAPPLDITMAAVVKRKGSDSNYKNYLIGLALQKACDLTFIIDLLALSDFTQYQSAAVIINSLVKPQCVRKVVFSQSMCVPHSRHILDMLYSLETPLARLSTLHSLRFLYEDLSLPDTNNFLSNSIKATYDVMDLLYNWQHLHSLSIPGCFMGGKMGHLSALRTPLTQLNVAATFLLEEDVAYLMTSHHCEGLEGLNISFNSLHHMVDLVCQFLRKLTAVKYLQAEACQLELHQVLSISQTLAQVHVLQLLNIHRNDLNNYPDLNQAVVACSKITSLKKLACLPEVTGCNIRSVSVTGLQCGHLQRLGQRLGIDIV